MSSLSDLEKLFEQLMGIMQHYKTLLLEPVESKTRAILRENLLKGFTSILDSVPRPASPSAAPPEYVEFVDRVLIRSMNSCLFLFATNPNPDWVRAFKIVSNGPDSHQRSIFLASAYASGQGAPIDLRRATKMFTALLEFPSTQLISREYLEAIASGTVAELISHGLQNANTGCQGEGCSCSGMPAAPAAARPPRLCTKCGSPAKKKCPVCRISYCSKTCQIADWAEHKLVCVSPPVAASPPVAPSPPPVAPPLPTCKMCPDTALFACARCKTTPYCSKQCQSADWVEHKKSCKFVKL